MIDAFDLGAGFALGLASSLHCIGMCGPIVAAMSLPLAARGKLARLAAHGAYHLGRTTTYILLGAVAGWAGASVAAAGRLAGLERGAALAGGAVLLTIGLILLTRRGRSLLVQLEVRAPARGATRAAARLLASRSPLPKGAMGLALGFLPCGMVYVALVKAAEAASALGGGATMAGFGAGTAVGLLALGAASALLPAAPRRWSRPAAAWATVILGAVLLWRGLGPMHASVGAHAAPDDISVHGHSANGKL